MSNNRDDDADQAYGRFAEATIKYINTLRRQCGMPEIRPQDRKCLRCEKEFKSLTISNRLCSACSYLKDDVF